MADEKQPTQEEAEAQAEVMYYYLPEENPLGASYPGIPHADLHRDFVEAQPEWVQKSLAASSMYVAQAPSSSQKGKTQSQEKPKAGGTK